MQDTYARVLFHLIEKGEQPRNAVAKIHAALDERGRLSLMPHIARAFKRLAGREARKDRSVLIVARAKDEREARKASGAADAELIVDENVIGGWRYEDKEHLTDGTFKKQLLSLYTRVTRT